MTRETRPDGTGPAWAGRLVTILVVAFVALVVVLMFFAVRGPGG